VIARILAGATLILTAAAAPSPGQTTRATTQTAGAGQGTAPAPPPEPAPTPPSGSPRTDSHADAPVALPAVPETAAGAGLVELTVVGAEGPYQSLRDRIGAHATVGGTVLWNRIDRFNPLAELLRGDARPRTRSLRCWVDLSDLRRATLYFAAPGGERFLVRDVALSGRLDEIDQQSLAQVLELSIAALLEDEHAGLSRAQAREVLSRAPPVAAPSLVAESARPGPALRWDVAIGAFYAVEEVAAALPVSHGPGLDLALRLSPAPPATPASPADRSYLGLWLAGQYQLPSSAQAADIGVRLQTAAVRAGIEAERWHLRARAGAGMDWIHVTPLAGSDDAPAALTPSHWSRTLVFTGSLAARLSMGRATAGGLRPGSITLALFVDVVPKTVRYQVQDAGGGVHSAFAPRRARPGLAVGLSF
jgi:hypothetical protein